MSSLPEDLQRAIDATVRSKDVSSYIQAISRDPIKKYSLKKPWRKRQFIERIGQSDYFSVFAVQIAQRGYVEGAKAIFEEILRRTPHDTTTLNDYVVVLLNEMIDLYNRGQTIPKEELELAKQYIYLAFEIDLYLHGTRHPLPAYKNVSLLRAVEAALLSRQGDLFTAFVLAWMSIEMSIYRLWYKSVERKYKDSNQKMGRLLRWDVEQVMEVLYVNNIGPEYVVLKPKLDTLRGTRNDLLHGNKPKPTKGETESCINTGIEIWKIT